VKTWIQHVTKKRRICDDCTPETSKRWTVVSECCLEAVLGKMMVRLRICLKR